MSEPRIVARFRCEGVILAVERGTGPTKWVVVRQPHSRRTYVVVTAREQVKGLKKGEQVLVEGDWDQYAQVHNAEVRAKWV